ncbi:NEW3 domain-containing protein [Thermus amyloliquefaciens]|uniref:NEW3 domain-containing protein n=1 Tax=Thermus amyloliquefaciens TaxID=1449080 RepID=UPI00057009BE|nr:NEW3 domain-containing protein [Thermus amyloliquefaciens]
MKGIERLLVLLLVLAMGLVLAAGTPAGTAIQNQASASYIDSAGQPRTTTSNLVTTIVQQVYSFTITPNGTETNPGQVRSALPGGQVLFQYTVTNTGNGTDTINLSTVQGTGDNFDLTNIQIYLDPNCNGNVDAGESPITSVTLAADASACVIVAATVPSSAQNGQYGNLNLAGTSSGNPSVQDNDNWARASVTTAAAFTAFKAASPSGSVQPGGTITYTISGSNTGGSAAYGIPVTVDGTSKTGILIEDTIPSGLKVSAMPTGSAGAGSIRYVYYDGTSWVTLNSSLLPITGDGTKKIGMLIEGTGAFFPQGAQYSFSFQAQVPANAPAGTSYPNAATVRFDANGDGDANDPGETIQTNTTTNTVAATYQPVVGYPGTVTLGNETQTVPSAYAGGTVSFTNVVRNGGNAPDSFTLTLTLTSPEFTFPLGTTCAIYAADGITPISGPIGPLAPGATQNVVVKCQLPANYYESPVDGPNTTYTVELKATSVNDPSKSDVTTDKLVDILPGYAVDLAAKGYSNDGNAGNDNPAGQSANPGQTVYFPLELTNTGKNPDTYNLSANVPSGWSVVFYPDTNCDGTPDGAPVTNVGPVNPDEKKCFVAAVSVPQGAAPGTQNVSFTATSTSDPNISDTVSSTVTVNLVAQVALDPDRQGTVTSPGTLVYTHTLINNSNAPATCTISGSGGAYGWVYQYSTDGANWSSSLNNVNVGPNGGTATIYVRVQVPAGEPIGRVDVNTVSASCAVGAGSASDSATETTTVVGGELRLEKTVDKATAYPGETLTYTITATNIGTGDLKKVIVTDPLPAYTDFVSASATISGFPAGAKVLYSTDGTTWSPTPPTSLPAGGSLYVAVDTNGDNTITDADVMPPAASIVITFQVQVR